MAYFVNHDAAGVIRSIGVVGAGSSTVPYIVVDALPADFSQHRGKKYEVRDGQLAVRLDYVEPTTEPTDPSPDDL
jgi:hypothetical protein